VWLWLALGTHKKFSSAALNAIEEAGKSAGLLVSIISVWEIALLQARQRIVLPLPVNEWFVFALSRPEIKLIGLGRPSAVVDSVNLPGELHGDPVDRFLIATARAHRAVLVTRDEKIIEYGKAVHVKVMAI